MRSLISSSVRPIILHSLLTFDQTVRTMRSLLCSSLRPIVAHLLLTLDQTVRTVRSLICSSVRPIVAHLLLTFDQTVYTVRSLICSSVRPIVPRSRINAGNNSLAVFIHSMGKKVGGSFIDQISAANINALDALYSKCFVFFPHSFCHFFCLFVLFVFPFSSFFSVACSRFYNPLC